MATWALLVLRTIFLQYLYKYLPYNLPQNITGGMDFLFKNIVLIVHGVPHGAEELEANSTMKYAPR